MGAERVVGVLYAPALSAGDTRVPAVLRALEDSLLGVRLDHVVEGGRARRVADRDGLLREAADRRALPFLFHGDEARYVMVYGSELHAVLAPARAPQWEVHVSLPLGEGAAAHDDAIAAVGSAAGAWWGAASPEAANVSIAAQVVHPHLPRQPPAGLPALCLPARLAHPRLPQRLGWINYWSAETAAALGFPDPARDAALLARSRPVEGGWVLRLTDAPLDLDRPEHLAALREAYDRLPEVGGRDRGPR
jgi:hypothetical protein